MASSTRQLCRNLLQITRYAPGRRKMCRPRFVSRSQSKRQFSCTTKWRAEDQISIQASKLSQSNAPPEPFDESDDVDPSEYMIPQTPITVQDLDSESRADYEALSKEEQIKFLALQNHWKAVVESAATEEELDNLARRVNIEAQRAGEFLDIETARAKGREVGFWAMDEDDELGQMEDADDEVTPDLITSVAQSELELHREIREYTRVAAWDMPLLRQFAKPFELPDHTTPLRFRYTTYMGEHHPAAKKVVVQFCTKELPGLTEQQRIKFIKLVGVRYNPDTDVVHMSCEKYEAPAQNKRYLADLINKLVAESKTGDTFEDVPLDFRHHKPKKQVQYPEEWKLTSKTVQALIEKRTQDKLLLKEGQKPIEDEQLTREYVMARGSSSGAVKQSEWKSR